MEKKFYIQTYGCQMNVHDSENISTMLEGAGYKSTDDAHKADVIILNTCSIREKAAQKAYSQLGLYKDFKKRNQDLIIGVGGCLAQQWGKKFYRKAPYLDFVFGTHSAYLLPELLEAAGAGKKRISETAFHELAEFDKILPAPKNGQVSAYVTIMQGCNNYCAYCVVPYLRGPEMSREVGAIIAEVKALAGQGVKEVTLLGQNVNSYGMTLSHKSDFASLLKEIAQIKGIERIRFTTSHPKDLSPELIRSFAEVDVLCKHIHLPVQSGSNKILRDMNRGYSREEYLGKVAALRAVCPDISITSDVIVGFPSEKEADFEETIELMDKVKFDNLFSFKYSEREGTAAVNLDHKVNESVKSARLRSLQSFQEQHTLAKNKEMVGKVVEVLVEGQSKSSVDELMGRTVTNKIVNFESRSELIGNTVPVMITRANKHSLYGKIPQEKEINRCL